MAKRSRSLKRAEKKGKVSLDTALFVAGIAWLSSKTGVCTDRCIGEQAATV